MAAAAIVGGLLTVGGGAVAHAADPVTGKPGSHDSDAASLKLINEKAKGSPKEIIAARLYVQIGEKKITAYCIDVKTPLGSGMTYTEGAWNDANVGSDLNKIQWILNHSFPSVSVDGVFKAAKVDKPADTDKTMLERIVYGGTQAAIWRYSDPADFALRQDRTGFALGGLKDDQYAAVYKIYDYLVKNATDQPEPAPKLEITPAAMSGEAGKKIGPFKIVSGGGEATVTATGGKIVDANGKELTSVPNGGTFYVQSDAPGTVTVNASGSGTVPIGRVFVVKDAAAAKGSEKKQKIILGDVAGAALKAQATVTVTTPTPALPVTGVKLTGAITAGALLVAAGVGLLMVRRRRVKFTV